jgi:Xaa-Pro dipeptidase
MAKPINRRCFLAATAAIGATASSPVMALAKGEELPNIAATVNPITPEERKQRLALLQAQLRKAGLGAILIEAGSSLFYFTGIDWWRSERITAALIPAEGEAMIVTPFFEAPSIDEMLAFKADVRTWNEHDNPMALVAGWLKERKASNRPLAMEETVREFIRDGIQQELPRLRIVSGAGPVRAVRMRKSPAEIALMQAAATITLNAMRYAHKRIEPGMGASDINALMARATAIQGGQGGEGLVLIGEASAYPHGSRQPQKVGEGKVVLLDAGCSVQGYASDISRTFVYGEPDPEVRKVWNQMRQGQQVAQEAARIGATCGSVDDAVRRYYEGLGYGPGYRLPGLSHRTGHGIGLDGHEPVNLVHGEKTRLAPGMCFSNEPGIYLPGKFGIRLEDCFTMTETGPRLFTELAPSIDRVFG